MGLDKMWGEPKLSSGRDCEQTRSGLKCEGHSLLNRWEMPAQLCPGRKPPSTPTERSGGGCSLQIVGFCYSQESPSSTLVEHPCYPKDYKETISLSSFRTSPCTNQSDPRLPLDDRNVTLEGRSNASGCLVAVKKLFNFSACGQSQDCSFDGIYQPPVSGQFFVRQTPSSSPQLCVSPRCCSVPLSPVLLSPPCSRVGACKQAFLLGGRRASLTVTHWYFYLLPFRPFLLFTTTSSFST